MAWLLIEICRLPRSPHEPLGLRLNKSDELRFARDVLIAAKRWEAEKNEEALKGAGRPQQGGADPHGMVGRVVGRQPTEG